VQRWKERLANKIQREIPTLDVNESAFAKYVLHADARVLAALEEILGSLIRLFSGQASVPLDEHLAQCVAEALGYQPQAPRAARGTAVILFDPEQVSVDVLPSIKLIWAGLTFSIRQLLTTVKVKNTDAALVIAEADQPGSVGNVPVGTQFSTLVPIKGIHRILANEDFTEGADAVDSGYLLIRELRLLKSNMAAPPPIRALAALRLPRVVPGFWHDGCFYVAEKTHLTTKVTLIPVSGHGTTILEEGMYPPFYEILGVLDGTEQETDYLVKVERQALSAETIKITVKSPLDARPPERVMLIARAIPDLLIVREVLSRLNVPVRAANLAILRIQGMAESPPVLEQLTGWCHSFLRTKMRERTISVQEIRQGLNNFGIELQSVFAEHLTAQGRNKISGEETLDIPDDTTIWVYDDDTFDLTTISGPAAPKQHAEVGADTPV